jgi:transposase, IS5 family
MNQITLPEAYQKRLESLSKMGDPLELLQKLIQWEEFRPILEPIRKKERKSNAGRKPFDLVFMFKVLILQTLYNLADEALEYQIRDRLSFMRFLDLGMEGRVPDATTVWLFRERLKELNLMESLFDQFGNYLEAQGYYPRSGQIIDASIILVPIQRNSREENAKIKNGEVPADWNKNKRAQKDTDARWTEKNGESYYGYKNHIDIDAEHKLIRNYSTTPANVHDSQVFDVVIDSDNAGPDVWADSAYRSEETEAVLEDAGYVSHINEKAHRGHPLTDAQKTANRTRSKVRTRVEHVFGFQENSMGSKIIRTIGIARAGVKIGLMNLTYNVMRYMQLVRLGISAPAMV